MNLSSTLAKIQPYQIFASNQEHQNKVIVAVNNNKLSVIPRERMPSDKDSLTVQGNNGVLYTVDDSQQIVAHFKEALVNQYGTDLAGHIFSSQEEAEAVEKGLSHAIVKQVFSNARIKTAEPMASKKKAHSFSSIEDDIKEREELKSSGSPRPQLGPEHDYRFMKLDLQTLQKKYRAAKEEYDKGAWLVHSIGLGGGEIYNEMNNMKTAINNKESEIAAFEGAHPELTWRDVLEKNTQQNLNNSSSSSTSASTSLDDTVA